INLKYPVHMPRKIKNDSAVQRLAVGAGIPAARRDRKQRVTLRRGFHKSVYVGTNFWIGDGCRRKLVNRVVGGRDKARCGGVFKIAFKGIRQESISYLRDPLLLRTESKGRHQTARSKPA